MQTSSSSPFSVENFRKFVSEMRYQWSDIVSKGKGFDDTVRKFKVLAFSLSFIEKLLHIIFAVR